MKNEILIDKSGHEYKKHGTSDFPVDFNISSELGFPLHFHDEMEIISIDKGSMKIKIRNKEFVLKKGDAIFINSGVPHEQDSLDDIKYVSKDIEFNPLFLAGDNNIIYNKYILPFLDSGIDCLILKKSKKEDNDIINDIEMLFKLNKSDALLKELKIKNTLSNVFVKIYERCKDDISKKNVDYKYDNVKKAISFIKDNYQKDIGLDDVTNIMNLSKRETQRLFKAYLGVSPYKCILKERLANSALLLTNSNLSITEICFKCGFKDTSSYINQFRNYYGKTPKQYRNSY